MQFPCARVKVTGNGKVGTIIVEGDKADIVNEGEVNYIEVYGAGAEIDNTGTGVGGVVGIEIDNYSAAGSDITVSTPGEANIFAYGGVDIEFNCYVDVVTVTAGDNKLCDGSR